MRRLIAEKARLDLFACPRCGNVIYERDERGRQLIPITDVAYFAGRKLKCSALVKRRVKRSKPNGQLEWVETDQPCAEPLYQLWRGQFSREPVTDTPAYPLAEYIRRRMYHWVELAVFDECFPGDTAVATPGGSTPIKDIQVGDTVLSYLNGQIVPRRVVRTTRKRREGQLVRVCHQGGAFVCTPNHKIYTGGIYVHAEQLQAGQSLTILNSNDDQGMSNLQTLVHRDPTSDPHLRAQRLPGTAQTQESRDGQAMSGLRKGVYPAPVRVAQARAADVQRSLRSAPARAVRQRQQAWTSQAATRIELRVVSPLVSAEGSAHTAVLRQGMQPPRNTCTPQRERTEAPAGVRRSAAPLIRAHEAKQPNERPGDPCQSHCGKARTWLAGHARRSWRAHARAAAAASRAAGLADGIPGRHGQSQVARGADGLGAPRPEDSGRVRRSITPKQTAAGARPYQGTDAERSRLDCPALYQRGDSGTDRHGAGANPVCGTATCLSVEHVERDDEFVYDLEVEDTHCYFAAGVLVSNCHTYKAQASDRGHAFGTLAAVAKRTVGLTATLFGGMGASR